MEGEEGLGVSRRLMVVCRGNGALSLLDFVIKAHMLTNHFHLAL
jgi:hypothetical protein